MIVVEEGRGDCCRGREGVIVVEEGMGDCHVVEEGRG